MGLLVIGIVAAFEFQAQRSPLAAAFAVYRDPDHRLKPNDPGIGTNSDGLRCAVDAGDLPEDHFRILFLGDSFVFGPGVGREGALPARFEAGLQRAFGTERIDVVNAGWPSSSPGLGDRLLRDIGRRYRPDLVLYGLDMSDFRDDLMYGNLLERRGIYRLANALPATLWLAGRAARVALPDRLYRAVFRMPKDRFFAVNQPLEVSRPDLEPTWRHLVAMDRFSGTALDAEFRLIVFPRNFQYSGRESPLSWEQGEYEVLGPHVLEPFRYFEERAAMAPFPVHSLLDAFRKTTVFPTCFNADPHWTPAGTGVAAGALVEIAVDEGWIPAEFTGSEGT